MKLISLFVAVLVLAAGMAVAGPSLLGTSGLLLTPDDSILPAAGFSVNYSGIDFYIQGETSTVMGANAGVNGKLEVGAARFYLPWLQETTTIFNAKYQAMTETAKNPSLMVGAVDLTGEVDDNGHGGFYVLVGKNLTSLATGLTHRPSQPLHGCLGFGSGIYNNSLFASLSWQLSPNLKIMGEYISQMDIRETLPERSMLNAGASFTFYKDLSGSLALVNGSEVAYGISYRKAIK